MSTLRRQSTKLAECYILLRYSRIFGSPPPHKDDSKSKCR